MSEKKKKQKTCADVKLWIFSANMFVAVTRGFVCGVYNPRLGWNPWGNQGEGWTRQPGTRIDLLNFFFFFDQGLWDLFALIKLMYIAFLIYGFLDNERWVLSSERLKPWCFFIFHFKKEMRFYACWAKESYIMIMIGLSMHACMPCCIPLVFEALKVPIFVCWTWPINCSNNYYIIDITFYLPPQKKNWMLFGV